ncbi:unnamed protein product [Candidula unifasciata]|uniref:Uncharacterized protein n=1 Tax=Candidula unifasciata TaxID=100452 RepID=A0A8S3YQX7_9EUPU|nr:unnamed protein product [Candidula unifasciata]
MAESNSKSGILALAQKRLSRTKTKVLQNLGKAEKTTDDVFNENVLKVERQQEIAHHLQKELKTYVHCLREMNQATLSLNTVLSEIYEPEWTKESVFKSQLQVFELLWNDFLQSVQDSVVTPLNNYLQCFPALKSKVAKRGRKMVDYDNCRHHLEVLLSAKKKDEVKIHKAQEEMKEAKRIYEELNSELRSELPDFNNSRVTFYASLLSSLFGAGQVFHSESGKAYLTLEDICQELGKDFEQFIYKPRQTLSKSISSNSGENGFSDEVSAHGSPSVQLTRSSLGSRCSSPGKDTPQSVYGNQEVPEIKQRTSLLSPQQNGSNPVPTERTDRKQSNISAQDRGNKVDEGRHSEEDNNNSSIEHKEMTNNVYNEPHETPSNLAASIGRVSNRHEFSESDTDEDDDLDPVYSNPPSRLPLATPPPNTLYVVQAVHRYNNEDEDELSFEAGEMIYVIEFDNPEEQDEGWQMGIKASDGVRGVFPENFTQVLPNQQAR